MTDRPPEPLDVTTLSRGDDARAPADPPRADNDPDANNAEQADAGSQAQDVAGDALARSGAGGGGLFAHDPVEESARGGPRDPAGMIPQDTPDLVETLHAMHASGRVDMGAFEGEEGMDEEDGYAGDTALVDGEEAVLELTDGMTIIGEGGDVPAEEFDAIDLDEDDRADRDDDGRVDRD